MSLTSEQRLLIRQSYAAICEKTDSYSALFYHRLHHHHPCTRIMFADDMARQIEVFRQTLDVLVEQLDDLLALHPTLTALAVRHVGYGVEQRHYAIIGDVLIDTFADMLGDRFTPDTREAWVAVYTATAGVMIDKAYPPGSLSSPAP